MEISPRDVLLRIRPGNLDRWQSLAVAGPSRGRVTPLPYTFARADGSTVATYIDRDGVLRLASANNLRFEWVDLDGDGIRETPGLLLEGSRTNTLLQSQALATTWTAALLTATNNVAIAPDQTTTATSLVPTAVSSAAHRVQQNVTITANENIAFSMKIRTNGYNAVRVQVVDTATAVNGFVLRFDASTGLFGTNNLVGTGSLIGTGSAFLQNNGTGYYHFSGAGTIGGGVTAVTVIIDVFNTIANANSNTAYTGDAVSGVLAWGAQLERGSAFASSYIKTTTGTVTRAADSLTLPFNFGPMDLTVLARLARPVWADAVGTLGLFPGVFDLGNHVVPKVRLYQESTSRNFTADISAAVSSTGSRATPAGSSITMAAQYKNFAAGGQAALDVGAGQSAFGSAATAFTAFGSQTLRVGGVISSANELYGVLLDLLICRDLRTLAEMVAVP